MKRTVKVYSGKDIDDNTDFVEYEKAKNPEQKHLVLISLYLTRSEFDFWKEKDIEVTIEKTAEERLRDARIAAVRKSFNTIVAADIVSVIEKTDAEIHNLTITKNQ